MKTDISKVLIKILDRTFSSEETVAHITGFLSVKIVRNPKKHAKTTLVPAKLTICGRLI